MSKRLGALCAVLVVLAVACSGSERMPQAYLVVIPDNPEVEDRVEVVGIDLSPGVAYGIGWTNHFGLSRDECGHPDGFAYGDDRGTHVELITCQVGAATLRLLAVDADEVVDEVEVTIVERTAPSRPTVNFHIGDGQLLRPRVPVEAFIYFSEPVTGFDRDDIVMENGVPGQPVRERDSSYFVYEVAPSGIGFVLISVREGAAFSIRSGLPSRKSQGTLVMGITYDDDHDHAINASEMLVAIDDYYSGLVTPSELQEVVRLFFQGPIPRADRCPRFHERDSSYDQEGFAVTHPEPHLVEAIVVAIEGELMNTFDVGDSADLDVVLRGEIHGNKNWDAVPVDDVGLHHYGLLRAHFDFAYGGGRGRLSGEARVWIAESPQIRRCAPTSVDLILPPYPVFPD